MYAIVDIAGQQFKVEKDNKMFVHRLENEEGSQVSFDKVLLLDNNGKVSIGEPVVDGASVIAKVVAHVKGDKVIVFKKKRRKGYQVMNGHRQSFSEIVIEEILESGNKAKATTTKATPKAEEAVEEKTEAKAPAKKAPVQKAASKEASAKKTATKKPATKKAEDKKESESNEQ